MHKKSIADFTESEFLEFIRGICVDIYPTEKSHINAIKEFERLSEHPAGSDLIYYPEDGRGDPENIIRQVKEWRALNGKSGFRQG